MLILRDALTDLLYFRHTFPYLHCGVVAQLLLDSQDHRQNKYLAKEHQVAVTPKLLTAGGCQTHQVINFSSPSSNYL